jgi:hypothetical protein
MKKHRPPYYIAPLIIALLIAGCKKVIQLDLANQSGQLVIEANFVYAPGKQVVKLSRNVPFTSPNTYPPVTGATVTMDNHHGRIINFTEGPTGYYTADSIGGTAGRTYTMNVEVGTQTYSASSTMPDVDVTPDSLAAQNDLFEASKGKKRITVFFQDPPGEANQYRFVMYVNHVQVKAVFAYDDQFIDGKYVNLDLQQNDIDIYAKDTVDVEMQCIDRPVYLYWFTLEQQQANNPGGAVAPANPPTNFLPATLGYFSAHTSHSIRLVVK